MTGPPTYASGGMVHTVDGDPVAHPGYLIPIGDVVYSHIDHVIGLRVDLDRAGVLRLLDALRRHAQMQRAARLHATYRARRRGKMFR